MKPTRDVYTPWRESPEALDRRHVGRDEELGALVSALDAFAAGERPLPIYLYGPRGSGKSHVVTLGCRRASSALERGGLTVLTVPEETPACSTVAALVQRFEAPSGPAWMRSVLDRASTSDMDRGQRVIVIEALHRHLCSMPRAERRALRGWFAERPHLYVIATGVQLGDAFGRDGAFYGSFDPYPLGPLEPDEAAGLLDASVADEVRASTSWPRRRSALAALAGGSPRSLCALGAVSSAQPNSVASDDLHEVIRSFTAHFLMRFEDLSPQEQQVIECMTIAPRELSPTEIGRSLGRSSSHASAVARRLEATGVLISRSEGRATWYRIAEPLFRHWYEYRTAAWEETRAGLAARLLEATLSPEELAAAWWAEQDPGARDDVSPAIGQVPEARSAAWARVLDGVLESDLFEGLGDYAQVLERALELPVDAKAVDHLCRLLDWGLMGELPPPAALQLAQRARLEVVLAGWEFERALATGSRAPAEARRELARALGTVSLSDLRAFEFPRTILHDAVARALQRSSGPGRPWVLSGPERRSFARIPRLRARFLQSGKLPTHPPLLEASDVLRAGVPLVDEDAWDLLVVAVSRESPPLFHEVLGRMLESIKPWTAARTKPTPEPARVCPAGANELLNLLSHSLGRETQLHRRKAAATWIASGAKVPEETWQRLIESITVAPCPRIRPSRTLELPGAGEREVELALSSLGYRAPARLEELLEASDTWPWLRERAIFARAMTAQLHEREMSPLHPELEAIWRSMALNGDGESARPRR